MGTTPTPTQKILFGCPGTGKSHKVETEITKGFGTENIINCVFHPEYSYGDFMGKLMPLSRGDKITYHYYAGHFMRALAQAYKNIKAAKENESAAPVALVIDEINRGNTAAIFGSVLQLLDREGNGWSSYSITISDMEHQSLLGNVLNTLNYDANGNLASEIGCEELKFIDQKQIKLPPNLSIIGTMNTSDESIYYMDSAFKRRWDWEYVDIQSDTKLNTKLVDENTNWTDFVDKLNAFIKAQSGSIRKVEDKQIGYWFIKAKSGDTITEDQIKNKLMFFLWDSVFQRDKKPLEKLLFDKESTEKLVTFGDFAKQSDAFIEKIKNYSSSSDEASKS